MFLFSFVLNLIGRITRTTKILLEIDLEVPIYRGILEPSKSIELEWLVFLYPESSKIEK